MLMCNLTDYSKNYSSLWNYYRDEPNNHPVDNYSADPIKTLRHLNTKVILQENTR